MAAGETLGNRRIAILVSDSFLRTDHASANRIIACVICAHLVRIEALSEPVAHCFFAALERGRQLASDREDRLHVRHGKPALFWPCAHAGGS